MKISIKNLWKILLRFTYIMLFALFFLTACSHKQLKGLEEELSPFDEKYILNDKNGTFLIKTSAKFNKADKTYTTKKVMEIPKRGNEGVLEKVLVVSSVGKIKNKLMTLRPKSSQYFVWFDGKKYSSELKINTKARAFDLKIVSPEPGQSAVKQIKFPNTKAITCFFSQIIECASVIGFIQNAVKEKSGNMNLFVVWEGYPFLNETFTDFPSELFSEASLEFDKMTEDGQSQFNLQVAGQSIFLVVNDRSKLSKMFWVTQGMTMVTYLKAKDIKKNSKPQEGEKSLEETRTDPNENSNDDGDIF